MSYRGVFAKLWESILEFNKKYLTEAESLDEGKIKSLNDTNTPLLPIKMNPYLFNRLFGIFSSIFIGENGNFIEITLDKSTDSITGITLIKSDISKNFIDFIENPIPELKIHPIYFKDIDKLFIEIKTAVFNKFKIDIGSVRIIDTRLFDLIKQLIEIDLEKTDFERVFKLCINILFDLVQYDYISIYPRLQLLQFAKDLLITYPNFREILLDLCSIKNILPKGTISITLCGDVWYSTLVLNYDGDKILNIQVMPPFEFGKLDKNSLYAKISLIKKIGKYYSKKYNTQANYILDPIWLKEILTDLIESPIPFEEARQNLILQKILLAIKNVETTWDVYPKPIFYNDLFRYFLRTLGYHISPRKISYWVLPEMFSFFSKKFIGTSYKTLIIISKGIDSIDNFSKRDKWTITHIKRLVQNSFGILISKNTTATEKIDYISGNELEQVIEQNNDEIYQLEQKMIKDISYLYPKFKLGKKISYKNFEITLKACFSKFRTALLQKYGIIDIVIFINQELIQKIITISEVENISKNPLKYIKNARALKNFINNAELFSIYPDLPLYQYIKQQGFRFSKEIMPLMFDCTEF